MAIKRFLLIMLLLFSTNIIAQESNRIFLYIPDGDTMSNYFNLHAYLRAWDNNEIEVDDIRLAALFNSFMAQDTLESLLFESFLRYTKNINVQNRILAYFESNGINNSFSNSIRKLYMSTPMLVGERDGNEVFQLNYNNVEFDENINLFDFSEVSVFNNEMGLLLFDNNWSIISFDGGGDPNRSFFTLIYGGGTNSMTISFSRYVNVDEDDIEARLNLDFHNERFNDNWIVTTLPIEGILTRAGADKIIIAHGIGPDRHITTIETGQFNVYLFNRQQRTLYIVSYFMNFSPININFAERNRIFNFLFFQVLFVFLR
jgi:hypothetical protein